MVDNLEKQLLFRLIRENNYVSSKDLAFSLGTSEKTVLKYLNQLKADLKDNGASLEVKHGYGSRLEINDQRLFNNYLADIGSTSIPSSKEERRIYVLYRLLTSDDFINIYDLADELYISASLLRLLIKDLADIIEKHKLTLKHSHSHGYRITGNEKDVRRCISKECAGMNSLDDFSFVRSAGKDLQGRIASIITKNLENYKIAISYDAINSLTLHILIAINRNETQNFIEMDEESVAHMRSSQEFYVMRSINKQMKEQLNIELPEIELLYLTIHLNGKQRLHSHEHLQVKIDDDALVFYNRFLRNIYQSSGYDFFDDEQLRISLLNHIVPFIARFNQNNLINKSSLAGIKNEFPYAYDLAVSGLSFLNDKNIAVTSEEIGYFALHLALAMEKNKSSDEIYDIAIISSEISSFYNITTFKIERSLKGLISSIKYLNVAEAGELNEESAASFHLILNMTDELFDFDNVMNVSSFLNENELDAIRSNLLNSFSPEGAYELFRKELYFDLDSKLKCKEIIRKMVVETSKIYQLPDGYEESVMERENMESTEFGHYIAVPHPLKVFCNEDFVAIARFDKPVMWNKQKIQIVFLINLITHKKTEWFMKKISAILSNESLCQNLLGAETFEEFVTGFENIN